ncbi:hypothetical protein ACLB2K_069066 [Fragaria x ananassa]
MEEREYLVETSPDSGHPPPDSGLRLPVADRRIPVTDRRILVTGRQIPVAGCRKFLRSPLLTPSNSYFLWSSDSDHR